MSNETKANKKKLTIKIYTDGACSGNPGPGGWSALLLVKSDKGKESITIRGGEKHTTNNRMELTAVAEAMQFVFKNLKEYDCTVKIVSDSSYVLNPIVDGWLNRWEKNGWKTGKQTNVLNKDIWTRISYLLAFLNVSFEKVKGHSGDKFNDHVDKVAVEESKKYKEILNNL